MDANNSLEVTGDTVDEAVSAGLEQLGVSVNDVLVEVIDEPSRGVFGIGARPAKVRIKLLRPPSPPPSAEASRETTDSDDDDSDDDDVVILSDYDEVEPAEDGAIGRDVLVEILTNMGLEADVRVRRAPESDDTQNPPWVLDIFGPNVSQLVGRRGETLNALQYITRLIVSRHLQRRANLIVDADGYKSRRSDKLRQLAVRMADQAVRQGRPIPLEPMPPNERRMVHLALRNREDVYTKSTGEGDSRKVMIIPK